jgi:membrane protein YdbS with pleckstrin-like domain
MGYAERNLVPGETIVYRARYHWTIYRVALVLFGLALLLSAASIYAHRTSADSGVAGPVAYLALGFTAVAVIGFLVRWIRASADEFVVTERRVLRKVGLMARDIEQAPLEKIQDISVDQTFSGRVLGYGTVTLETASERGSMTFPRIARPQAFKNALWAQASAPASSRPGVSPAALPPAAAPARERLAELDGLRQQGLVTEEEYAAKRREIIAGL